MAMSKRTSSTNTINSSFNENSILADNDENNETTTILWFDSNISSYEYTEQINDRLQQINADIGVYTEVELCLNFVQSNDKQKIFLVISGSSTTQLLPHIVKFSQVDTIVIFCTEKTKYEHLTIVYSKIIGIYTDFDLLCTFIREEINFNDKQLITFSFFNKHQTSTKYMSKESAEFLWFQIVKHVILQVPHDQQEKKQMISMCQQYYRDNLREQRLIDQFEREYRTEEAIRWYSKQTFISKLITKALRNQDIDQLHTCCFFIIDLTENLSYEHQKILSSNEQILIVYRGAKLSKEELNKLRENEGALISMNGYFSASHLYPSALALAIKPTKRMDVVSVLFQIECNVRELGKNVIFADIAQYSEYSDKKEVLFDINTTFRLKSIQQHDQIWLVTMSASNDGQEIAKGYMEEKYHTTEEKSLGIVFGRLMCNLGQYDKAQKYFQRLLSDGTGEDLAWIEFNLGRTLDLKGESKLAQKYYNHAYEQMMNTKPTRWKEAAYILNKLGMILHDQGTSDKALIYYQRALKIQQKFGPSDHVDNARILNNIALILNMQGTYEQALDYYQRALKMLKRVHTSDHIDIAQILNNIGNIHYQKGSYNEAADHYQQALKIQQNLYPGDRIETAQILNNIGLILNIQGKYIEALDLCQRALKIQQKLYPTDHIDIAGSLNNIGLILYNREKYEEALYYYQQSFKIREKYHSSDHVDIARSLNNIGNILFQQNKFGEALDYYLQTLAIQEKVYSPSHTDIALCLNNIGCTLARQEKYKEAFHYHQNALKIQQKLYTSGHPDIAYSLNNIGNIFYQQQEFNEALHYHLRALKMREKFYPSGRIDIGDSLNNIGMTYERMQELKMSLAFFQRALAMYQKSLPSGHPNIEIVMGNIRRITAKK
jgi:tetratricopeptide (TPR) repeat protein